MYTEAEHAAFAHLKKAQLTFPCEEHLIGTAACLELSSHTLQGGTSVQQLMARLPKTTLKRLYVDARSGSIDSMSTISMLYLVGFGLDKNESKSMDWMNFSLLEPASITFDEALSDLRKDIIEFEYRLEKDDHVHPESRNLMADSIMDVLGHEVSHLSTIKAKLKKSNPFLSLTPVIAGVRVTFVYKVSDNEMKDCYLHDAFIDNGDGTHRFSLDAMSKLKVPNMLGELRRKQTVVDYPKMMGEANRCKYFAVRGVLAVPASRRKELRKRFPDIANARELVDAFLSSHTEHRAQFVDSAPEISKLRTTARMLRDKADKYKAKGKKIPAKLKAKFAEVKAEVAEIRIGDVKRKLDLELSYPEAYLDFLALEIVGISKSSKIYRMSVKPSMQSTHLQGLGFKTLNHPAIGISVAGCTLRELTEKRLHALVEKQHLAYQSEYRIGGILIQPNDTVDLSRPKRRRRYIYKISNG